MGGSLIGVLIRQLHFVVCVYVVFSLQMIARQGKFVEFSVFGRETSVDWTIISDAKGEITSRLYMST